MSRVLDAFSHLIRVYLLAWIGYAHARTHHQARHEGAIHTERVHTVYRRVCRDADNSETTKGTNFVLFLIFGAD